MDNKKSICILPWIAFNTTPQGKSRPCGYSALKSDIKISNSTITQEFNNSLFREIRKSFLKGEWHNNCIRCRNMQEAGIPAKLDEENSVYYDDNRYLINQTNEDGSIDHYPSNIDIRLGTVCNLKCIHCGVGNSSKWLEDTAILNEYENLKTFAIDNSWVDRPNEMWADLMSNINNIKRFNWLGGEPFASKQHNRFMKTISDEQAKNISLQYVTNGLLLNENILLSLSRFKTIDLNISIDVIGEKAEYFRYPLRWDIFLEKLKLLQDFIKQHSTNNFVIKFQWTASNMSMLYFDETYDFCVSNFPEFVFTLCNYVDFPAHMSPQCIPEKIKKKLTNKLLNYDKSNKINFYISYMNKENLWQTHGKKFLKYINDLNNVRNILDTFDISNWSKYEE